MAPRWVEADWIDCDWIEIDWIEPERIETDWIQPEQFVVRACGAGRQPQARGWVAGLPLLPLDRAIGLQHEMAEGLHPAQPGFARAVQHLQAQFIRPEFRRS